MKHALWAEPLEGRLLLSTIPLTGGSDTGFQNPALLLDINQASGSAFPSKVTECNGAGFFVATDGDGRRSLWRTDGTREGTVPLVSDMPETPLMQVVGQRLYVRDSHDDLWVSDGTPSGTRRVPDARFSGYGVLQDAVFTTSPIFGSSLRRHFEDGTWITAMMAPEGHRFTGITSLENQLLLTSTHQDLIRLWRLDDLSGAWQITDLPAISGYALTEVVAATPDGRMYIRTMTDRPQLWFTDGTNAGTLLLGDIDLVDFTMRPDGRIFFPRFDEAHGLELWTSDGTVAGTKLVKDIAPGQTSSNLSPLLLQGDEVIFTASHGPQLHGIWRSDGTEAGTVLLKEVQATSIALRGDAIYFTTESSTTGEQRTTWTASLWRSDAAGNTQLVTSVSSTRGHTSIRNLSVVGDSFYMAVDDGIRGSEVWTSDGTPAGMRLVRDINDATADSAPTLLAQLGGLTFFIADDVFHGEELWCTDGTPEGTRMVKDIAPGEQSSWPRNPVVMNGHLYFTTGVPGPFVYDPDAPQPDSGVIALWRTDGTEAGTVRITPISYGTSAPFSSHLTVSGDRIFFINAGSILMVTDGTPGNATELARGVIGEPVAVDGGAIFTVRAPEVSGQVHQIWRTDGTSSGTWMLHQLWSPSPSAVPSGSLMAALRIEGDGPYSTVLTRTSLNGAAYFTVLGRNSGLWSATLDTVFWLVSGSGSIIDGQPSTGRALLRWNEGLTLGPGWSEAPEWPALYDSTTGSFVRLKPVLQGAGVAQTFWMEQVGQWIVFAGSTSPWDPSVPAAQIPTALWITDGTVAGTRRIEHANIPMHGQYAVVGENMYLGGSGLMKLNVRDGTVSALHPDAGAFTRVGSMLLAGQTLFFSAERGKTGQELWRLDLAEEDAPLIASTGRSVYLVHEGRTLYLEATGSSLAGSLEYSWDLNGDGIFGDAIGYAPRISWQDQQALGIAGDAGPWSVRVRVTSGAHSVISDAVLLQQAVEQELIVDSSCPSSGHVGELLQFSANIDYGLGPIQVFWAVNGQPATSWLPLDPSRNTAITLLFQEAGAAVVTLHIRKGNGSIRSVTYDIDIASSLAFHGTEVHLAGPASAEPGQTVMFSGSLVRLDPRVTLVSWRINEEAPTPWLAADAPDALMLTHAFTTAGTHMVYLRVKDADGLIREVAHPLTVASVLLPPTDPVAPPVAGGPGVRVFHGTARRDVIRVLPAGKAFNVVVNGVSQGVFNAKRIVVFGHEGDDLIVVHPSIKIPVELFGGAGNDRLFAGGGPAILIGGDGNDALRGGSANDLLIGGNGRDSLWGNGGQDLLIGSPTAHDADPLALRRLAQTWSSNLPLKRRLNLMMRGSSLADGLGVRADRFRDQIWGSDGDIHVEPLRSGRIKDVFLVR